MSEVDKTYVPAQHTLEIGPSREAYIIHHGDVLHQDKLWEIYVSNAEPSLSLCGSDARLASTAQTEFLRASRVDYFNSGQCMPHLESMQFIMDSWEYLCRALTSYQNTYTPSKEELIKEQIVPEVDLRLPMFNSGAGHTLDCIGNDLVGNFYIVEIGRGHKTDQLNRQLYLARTSFPGITINGVVAKYKQTSDTKRRLFMQFI